MGHIGYPWNRSQLRARAGVRVESVVGLLAAALGVALAACTLAPAAVAPANEAPPAAEPVTVMLLAEPAAAPLAALAEPATADQDELPGAADLAASPAVGAADDAPASALRPARIPFRTQRDGSRWAGSNCGPAALGMILEARGILESNDALRLLAHTYQGTVGVRTGTALEHIAQVAEDYGVPTRGLYGDEDFRRWTTEDIRAEVAQGNPVVALVKYRLLPGRESAGIRFDHYIVLWDLTPDGFVYNDSSYAGADEGYARTITSAQLETAMRPTMVPQQAVAFLLHAR